MPIAPLPRPTGPTRPTPATPATPAAVPAQPSSTTPGGGYDFSDPDSFYASAIETARFNAAVTGIQGFVVPQAFHTGMAAVLDLQWKGLQLNPLTARFYDGVPKRT